MSFDQLGLDVVGIHEVRCHQSCQSMCKGFYTIAADPDVNGVAGMELWIQEGLVGSSVDILTGHADPRRLLVRLAVNKMQLFSSVFMR